MLLASPMAAELGGTFLNHAPTAFSILLAVRALALSVGGDAQAASTHGRWTSDLRHGVELGLGVSLAFLCRPADAAACGLLLAVFALSRPAKAWKSRRALLVAASVFAVALGFHIAWTQIQTGDWRVPGHALYMGESGKYGFSKCFTPTMAVRQAVLRFSEFATKATGWPIAAVFTALIPLFVRRWRAKAMWLWLFPLALSGVYFFFFWYEICFPGRYLSVALAPVLLLSSAGWLHASRRLGVPLAKICLVPAALGVCVALPARLASFDDHWHDVERVLPRVVKRAGLHNAVVIRQDLGRAVDRIDHDRSYFASSFILNDPDFHGDVVHVHNLRSRNAELPALFPGRSIWLYRYRRNKNLAELYRETFDPETGEVFHKFVPLPGLPGYADPARDGVTLPDSAP